MAGPPPPRRGASPRDLARQVLRRVEQGEAYATLALGGALERARLADPDRALATELVYGVLRLRSRLDRAVAAHAPRGIDKLPQPAKIALRVAAYQLLFTRVPPHAAVNDAVAAVRATAGERVAGFANAVLRRLAARGEPPPPEELGARLEVVHAFPGWLAHELLAAVGADEAEDAAAAMNRPAPVALRVSLDRTTRDEVVARLRQERPGAEIAPSPHNPEGILVRGGGAPETLAVFLDGSVTVQDVAAQLVGRLLGVRAGERILDACAGVGGKSTHLAQLARGDGAAGAQIDAADASRRKLDLAEDTIRRLGVTGVRTIVADLADPAAPGLSPTYDRVLLDAPCSGLGVLRRHPEAKWRAVAADVNALAALQARLLTAVARRVRPGGVLVYGVCTFTAAEGPDQVAAFLRDHRDFHLAPPEAPAAFVAADGTFRSWPHRHDSDAFFAACLVRAG